MATEDWLATYGIPRALVHLETLAALEGGWWMCEVDRESLADLCWAAALRWCVQTGRVRKDALVPRHPGLLQWAQRVGLREFVTETDE